jgi:hypothetical protein
MNDSIAVAMVDTFKYLLNTMRRVGLAVEFPGNDVLEQFTASDSGIKQ